MSLNPSIETNPIVGYRHWLCHDGRLYGNYTGLLWPRRAPLWVSEPHEMGDVGVYAYSDDWRALNKWSFLRKQLRETGSTAQAVCGSVSLWGDVVEHEWGYRAEFAYPKELWVPPEMGPIEVRLLEHGYGVPVLDLAWKVTKLYRSWSGVTLGDALKELLS